MQGRQASLNRSVLPCAWMIRARGAVQKDPHRYKGGVGPVSGHAQERRRRRAGWGRLLPAGRGGQRLIGACRSLVLVVPLRQRVVHKGVHLGRHIDVLAVTRGHLQTFQLSPPCSLAISQGSATCSVPAGLNTNAKGWPSDNSTHSMLIVSVSFLVHAQSSVQKGPQDCKPEDIIVMLYKMF